MGLPVLDKRTDQPAPHSNRMLPIMDAIPKDGVIVRHLADLFENAIADSVGSYLHHFEGLKRGGRFEVRIRRLRGAGEHKLYLRWSGSPAVAPNPIEGILVSGLAHHFFSPLEADICRLILERPRNRPALQTALAETGKGAEDTRLKIVLKELCNRDILLSVGDGYRFVSEEMAELVQLVLATLAEESSAEERKPRPQGNSGATGVAP